MESMGAKPQNAAEVLDRCRNVALAGLEEITKSVVNKATEGSCPHAKFAFELAQSGMAVPEEQGEDSLAALLLRELEKPAAADPGGTA